MLQGFDRLEWGELRGGGGSNKPDTKGLAVGMKERDDVSADAGREDLEGKDKEELNNKQGCKSQGQGKRKGHGQWWVW